VERVELVVEIEAVSAEDSVPENAVADGVFEVAVVEGGVAEEVEADEGHAVLRKAIRSGCL